MPSAKDLDLNGPISMLLKSPFGFGKTIAACSAAIDGPLHLCYWDKKQPVELVKFYKENYPDLLDNITYDVFSSANAGKFLEFLYQQQKRCDYKTIVTDSVTMMTASAVNWSIGFRNPAGAKKDNFNNPMTIPDWDEYKVETGLVTQALDIFRTLPCNVIWTAHPLPSLKLEGGGKDRMQITKVNNIVSYGSKVGAIVPGQFTEIYHLSKEIEWVTGIGSVTKRLVNTVDVGDDFAKTALGLPAQFDITGKLFWSEWKQKVKEANQ